MRWIMDRPADADPNYVAPRKEGEYFDSAGAYNKANELATKLEILNGYFNHPVFWEHNRNGRAVSADTIPKGRGPALILGSGPSLDKIMPRIKEWKGAVFTSTTQATTCVHWGKDPDYVVAMDVKTDYNELSGVDWENRKTKLCIHPGLSPAFIDKWPKDFVLYRQMDPNSHYHTQILTVGYAFITTHVMVFGTTMATQVSLARLMGYSPLILCGCDLGYPGGKVRFTRYRMRDEEVPYEGPPFFDDSVTVMADNGVISDRVFLFYKRALYCVWRLDRCQLISASDGVLYELPHASPDRVIDTQGDMPDLLLTEDEIKKKSEKYLATKNTYVIEVDGGMRLVEAADWRRAIPQFCAQMVAIGVKGVDADKVLKHVAEIRGEELPVTQEIAL